MFNDLRTRGIVSGQGEPRRLLTEFRQLRRAQLAYERELGMLPTTRRTLRLARETEKVPSLSTYIAAKAAEKARPRRAPVKRMGAGGIR